MGEVHYMISEASKRVNVEPHVLRYWEEELELPIGRTEMGHRYYTKDNLQLFDCIKELKEQGLSLKELKCLIPDILRTKEQLKKQKTKDCTSTTAKEKPVEAEASLTISEPVALEGTIDSGQGLAQVQTLIANVVEQVLVANNKVLEEAVSSKISENVAKNMDYLLQAKERQEEERYLKLDRLIRQQQTIRKESAHLSPARRLRKLLGEL